MLHVTIPDEEAEIVYLNQTGTGPFAFTFPYFAKDDLRVYVDLVLLSPSAWSVTPASTVTGGFVGGSVTLVDSVTDAEITIERMARPGRASDFGVGGARPQGVDSAFDLLHAIVRDLLTNNNRSIRLKAGDQTGPLLIGNAAERADKIMKFAADGLSIDLISSTNVDVLAGIASELTALAAATDEVIALGDPDVIADMAALGDADVLLDITALADAGVLAAIAAIKADLDLDPNSHILNALANATIATTKAAEASDDADAASLDAISANLAENAIATLVEEFNVVPGVGPYADRAAAITAGGVPGEFYVQTGDKVMLITASSEIQVSLTAEQTTLLASALLGSLVDLEGIGANKGLHTDGTNSLASHDQSAWFRSNIANLADGAALTALLSLGDLAQQNTVNNDDWSGADLSVANGGTGGSDAATARTNLGAQEGISYSFANPGFIKIPTGSGIACLAFGSVALGSSGASGGISMGVTFTSTPFVLASGGGGTASPVSSNATSTLISLVNGSVAQTARWIAIGTATA